MIKEEEGYLLPSLQEHLSKFPVLHVDEFGDSELLTCYEEWNDQVDDWVKEHKRLLSQVQNGAKTFGEILVLRKIVDGIHNPWIDEKWIPLSTVKKALLVSPSEVRHNTAPRKKALLEGSACDSEKETK